MTKSKHLYSKKKEKQEDNKQTNKQVGQNQAPEGKIIASVYLCPAPRTHGGHVG